MLNYSVSEENYIKAIYHLQQMGQNVTTNQLAAAIHTSPASTTDMMKKLKNKKLLNYKPYQGFRLSVGGSKVALSIIRRHRLWEYFLAEKLKFTWDEVHAIAEDLEHVSNTKLINRLDEFLGFPGVDPHGDPIPDEKGNIATHAKKCLTDWPLQTTAQVVSVSDHSGKMLELLEHKKIKIGTKLSVRKKFDFDGSMEIKLPRQPLLTISEQLAKNIFVNHDT